MSSILNVFIGIEINGQIKNDCNHISVPINCPQEEDLLVYDK